MSIEVADKLAKARALIEKGWIQHAHARAANGRIPQRIEDQVCWCAYGAILRANWPVSLNDPMMDHRCIIAFEAAVGSRIAEWNDAPERTQAEVIEAFRKAEKMERAS